MTTPAVGDFAVIRTHGFAADAIRFGCGSKWNHAAAYIGGGQLVEAQPGGARLAPWDKYGADARWVTPRNVDAGIGRIIAAQAALFVGIPYGFADIVAVAFAQRRLGRMIDPDAPLAQQPWWVRRIESTNTLICSQLVDLAYMYAGVHLFNDGRIPGLVTPGDLAFIAGIE